MVGGSRTLVEDDLWWKMTFGARRPLVEDNLQWKTTFGGRRPSVEDDFQWKLILAFLFGQVLFDYDLSWILGWVDCFLKLFKVFELIQGV